MSRCRHGLRLSARAQVTRAQHARTTRLSSRICPANEREALRNGGRSGWRGVHREQSSRHDERGHLASGRDHISPRRPRQMMGHQAATTASSSGPRTGDELRDEVHRRSRQRRAEDQEDLGTAHDPGSPTRPLNSMSRFGSSVAISRAAVRSPARYR
jgi:hypothetical protein